MVGRLIEFWAVKFALMAPELSGTILRGEKGL